MPLYLVRHGETDWNREKRFQSRTDVPLNELGLAQAQAVRDEFRRRGVHFTAARCSPLGRAVETARIILDGSGLVAQVEETFIEIDFSGFEGRLEAELREEYGEAFTAWRASEYTTVSPAGGESIITGADRVRDALLELTGEARSGNVLVVAHQAVNMAMKVALSGKTDVASAATFRQRNNDVDIWDMDRRCRLEMFSVCT
jgi:probable phosphoglycerate mutase